jgi:hypothetical protein
MEFATNTLMQRKLRTPEMYVTGVAPLSRDRVRAK